MKIGWFAGIGATSLDDLVASAKRANDSGFDTFWLPQVTGLDALVALAVVAREVPRIELATGVVPIQGRHPIPLALAALTVADAAGPGRFTLGLGLTHPSVSENWYGIPYKGIVEVCGEVLTALNGLLSQERRVDFDGAQLRVHAATPLRGPAPGLMLAAMAPKMVRLAGQQTEGTITWMTGPKGVAIIAQQLRDAAEAAGRSAPRVAAGIPICVTGDPARTKAQMAQYLDMAVRMPAYRRQVDIEGLASPSDLAVVGSEAEVDAQLDRFVAAGMTDLCANVVGSPEDVARTVAYLMSRRARA
jgi:F420-dependent oxidoreductase-like protein